VREQRHWFAVRGNHDDGALAVALGDERRRKHERYSWIWGTDGGDGTGGDGDADSVGDADGGTGSTHSSLSDDDVDWLANLPYTITIPAAYLLDKADADQHAGEHSLQQDIIIVHAGLIPGVPLEMQHTQTMITVRELQCVQHTQGTNETETGTQHFIHYKGGTDEDEDSGPAPKLWGKIWDGPQHVIFGHDARRGLQINDHSTGLDTGVCYGGELTGIILPGKTLVSVKAEKRYSPIGS